ncbi:MAG: hypothetical protein AAFV25_14225, partial [Bacteroidota bacterium]
MLTKKKNSESKGKKAGASKPFFSRRAKKKPSLAKPKVGQVSAAVPKKEEAKKEQQKKKDNKLKRFGQRMLRKMAAVNPFKQKTAKKSEVIKQAASPATAKPTKENTAQKEQKIQAPIVPQKTMAAAPPKKVTKVSISSTPPSMDRSTPMPEDSSSPEAHPKEIAAPSPKPSDSQDSSPVPTTELASPSLEDDTKKDKEKPNPEPVKEAAQNTAEDKSANDDTAPADQEEKTDQKGEGGTQQKGTAKKQTPPPQKTAAGGGGPAAPPAAIPKPTLNAESSDGLLQSLNAQPPTGFAQGIKQAGPLAASIQQKEKSALKEDLPEMEQPTGLPTKGKAPKEKIGSDLKKEKAPDLGAKGAKESQQILLEHPQTTAKANIANIPTPRPPGGEDDSQFKTSIRSAMRNLQTKDNSINTSAGERPKMQLKGDADPGQNQQNQASSDLAVDQEQVKANAEISKDFGENDIFPEMELEQMRPQIELSAPPAAVNTELKDLPSTSSQVYTAFDQQAGLQFDQQIQLEMGKHDEERQKMEDDSAKEKREGQQKIELETQKVRTQQEAEQGKAKGQVQQQRENWKKENEQVKAEYTGKSAAKKKEIDSQIDSKVKETDQKVDKELTGAEQKAEGERIKTEAEAQRKKKEAEEKEKKQSFWDRVASAVSSFFDALKSALNGLFDGLRKLVKGIIELAKKAVNGLIELARKAIVGLIQAFGEALKAFVSVALAAFPEIAKKINGFIDKAVDVAVNVVNQLAEGLKKIASAILDAIGAALDFILAAYQAFYNLLLDALAFIAVGIIRILEGIANLVSAAGESPGQFFGQLSEELLGQDVTKPLPNERPAVSTQPVQTQIAQAQEFGDISGADAAFLSKDNFATGDFQMDSVPTNEILPPAILQQLAAHGDGVIEFGASNDPAHSMDAVKQDLTGMPPAATTPSSAVDAPATAPVSAAPASTQVAQDGQGMVGPFSGPAERAGHLISQMTTGVKKWFSDNKVAIIAALVLGITGVILANILTGGAIMAALPLLMQIVSVYFAAEALFKVSTYFGKYLMEAFPGNIGAGAKSLARGLAIGAMELVFALLFGGKAAVKAVKAGAKAAKGGIKGVAKAGKSAAKGYVKANVEAAQELGQVARKGAQATMKNGKAMFKGVKSGFTRSAKSLDDLGKRLSKKFRFKKFKLARQNKRWRLLGQMNPWVLLAEGKLEFMEESQITRTTSKGKQDLGHRITVNGTDQQGIIVGTLKKGDDVVGSGSAYVDDLIVKSAKEGELAKVYKKLDEMDDLAKRRDAITNTKSFDETAFDVLSYGSKAKAARKARGTLATNIGTDGKLITETVGGVTKTYSREAHHLFPVELLTQSPILRKAIEGGFEFNSKSLDPYAIHFTVELKSPLNGFS